MVSCVFFLFHNFNIFQPTYTVQTFYIWSLQSLFCFLSLSTSKGWFKVSKSCHMYILWVNVTSTSLSLAFFFSLFFLHKIDCQWRIQWTHIRVFLDIFVSFFFSSHSQFSSFITQVIYTLTAVVGDGERVDEGGKMVGWVMERYVIVDRKINSISNRFFFVQFILLLLLHYFNMSMHRNFHLLESSECFMWSLPGNINFNLFCRIANIRVRAQHILRKYWKFFFLLVSHCHRLCSWEISCRQYQFNLLSFALSLLF